MKKSALLTLQILCLFTFFGLLLILHSHKGSNIMINEYLTEISQQFIYTNVHRNNSPEAAEFIGGYAFADFADFTYEKEMPDSVVNNEMKVLRNASILFVKAELLQSFFQKTRDSLRSSFILITHYNDEHITEKYTEIAHNPLLLHWFALNAGMFHPKLTPIPLGLTSERTYFGDGDRVDSSMEMFQHLPPFNERRILLYANIRVSTNYRVRGAALRAMEKNFGGNRSDVEFGNFDSMKKQPRLIYLSHLRNVKFVLSPPGFGLDCFRTWEALAMGCIPIVLNNTLIQLYKQIRALIVNDWNDVTEDRLKQFEKDLVLDSEGLVKTKALYKIYWWKKLEQMRRRLLNT